jgi:hypothetical protein
MKGGFDMAGNQEKILAEVMGQMGRFILEGGQIPKLYGDEEQARIIRRAALASRRLYEALCDERSTLDTIAVMTDEKRRAAVDFERAIGRSWSF